METIMYTNSKREGSNYEVDRIVPSERMEVSQLIQNEMVRYNISRIHFWFVRDNIALIEDAKAETMLVALGRYVLENKDSNFRFQYIVEKYQEREEVAQQQENDHNFKMDLSKSVEKDDKATRPNLQKRLIREEIIKEEIRFGHFKEFELFIKNELRSNQDLEIIKKYLFQTQEETIAISFFQSQQKELVHKIIDEDCNQIYNAKLNYRKISTIHPQDYQKTKKKKKEDLEQPIQLYHRIVLFLYSTPDRIEDIRESKRKKTHKSNGPPAGAEALQGWRVKEQVQSILKYEKECELIKQEIQNEKLIFRNKIKVIQNYIGDTINVEKLYQEEEQLCTNGISQQQMNNNTLTAPTFKKPPNLLKRFSVTPAISQTITTNIEKLSKFSPVNSFVPLTEFKRLKDISQAMRTIDNTILDQNKKIDQLKAKAKELKKLKEQVLFKNAKERNGLRRKVLELTQQIQRKKEEIREKQTNGHFETLIKYKGRQPSQAAKENLQEHIKFISQHHKGTQNNQLQYEYQYMKEEEKSTHRSLHRKDSEEVNTATAKYREKKMQEAMTTMSSKLKVKEEVEAADRNSFQMKASSNMSNLLLQCDSPSITSSLAQLTELHRYYLRNQKLINLLSKQISHYKLINHSTTTLSSYSAPNLDLSDFPLLQNALEMQSYDDLCQPIPKETSTTVHYKVQSNIPRDCFEHFIYGDKHKPQSKNSSLRSSMRQDIDKHHPPIVSPKAQPIAKHASQIWSKPSKFKRITIQQALHSNSLLRRVKMQE